MKQVLRLALLLACSMSFSMLAAPKPVPPNLVFLLVDDLRWNALGFMGDKIVQTPHLDRLAARSLVFDNCFVTTSICSVSRASIFTGQWMRRHGIEDFAAGLNGAAWDHTYPAQLRSAGFRTGFIGKYGVGSVKETQSKATAFDYWKGLPGQAGEFIEKNDPTRTHKTARFGNEALEFLGGCSKDKPFCLSISFNAVHARDGKPREFEPDPRDEELYKDVTIPVPKLATDEAFQRLPESVQKSEGRTRWRWRFDTAEKTQRILRDYYRLITGVDREVGRILAELEQRGLAENTVILFTGDNGFAFGDRGMADKWFMYEEDIRVPLFIHDPRLRKPATARRSPAMVLNVDFAPTMLELAGAPVPKEMQGRSLVPFLRGESPKDWRTEFFYEHHSVAARIPQSEGIRTERWKYLRWIAETPVKEELYDLQADPLEERNLLNYPEQSAVLAELRSKWERAGRDLR